MAAIITLVAAICAVKAVSFGWLPYGPPPPPQRSGDPILATVGPAPIRVSDLRAQAGPAGRGIVSAEVLVKQGFLDDAAQQLALAQAAQAAGLDQALEVRAALALARRRVLSEAYLDLAVSRAVTPLAVQDVYDRELALARAHDRVTVRHLQLATLEEAEAAKRRAERGERFAVLAARLSRDAATKDRGGSFGMIHPDALPPALIEASRTAPIGALIGPIETDAGFHLLRVDARRQLAVASLEARTPAIEDALRANALRQAALDAAGIARVTRQDRAPASAPIVSSENSNRALEPQALQRP